MNDNEKTPRSQKTPTLNVFLGLREREEKTFKNMLEDMSDKFKKKQGMFLGENKTYVPFDGYTDEPAKRSYVHVASTAMDQLDYLKENTRQYLEVVMSIEKTNCLSGSQVELIVENDSWGMFTQLELLRLKGILDNSLFKQIYANVPTRDLSIHWSLSEREEYKGRGVWETKVDSGKAKTTTKTTYIVQDPHADKGNRPPVTATTDTQVEVGEFTSQKFSGALGYSDKARMITKIDTLYKAVIAALEECNAVEIIKSDLGTKLFDYIQG